MTRIIRVTRCAECPKMHKNWRNGDPYCGASERMVWLTDIETVHAECPLEVATVDTEAKP